MASIPFCVRPWGRSPWAAQTRSSSMRSSSEIQHESSTLPSRLEAQRRGAMGVAGSSLRLYTSIQVLLLLAAVLLAAPLRAGQECQASRERRDQLARQAMQAEIALLHDVRQRLCPRQEATATDANALNARAQPSEAPAVLPFDYGAYIRCRAQAENQLLRTRPVLYRNRLEFTFYTHDGARWAQEADALQAAIDGLCPPSQR